MIIGSLLIVSNFSDRFKKGVYAISVSGRLPPAVIRDMQTNNIPYRNRDTSKRWSPDLH